MHGAVFLAALLGSAVSLRFREPNAAIEDDPLLISYHVGGKSWLDSDGTHLAYSEDGKTWTPLYGPQQRDMFHRGESGFGGGLFLKPEVGNDRFKMGREANGGKVLRDPFIIQDPNTKKFHMLWTNGWASRTIGHASSDDLVDWGKQHELFVTKGLHDAINAWAPEAIYDKAHDQFVVIFNTAQGEIWKKPGDIGTYPFQIFYVTTRNFEHFSEPKVLFDPGHTAIDATMIEADGKYYLVYKHEQEKALYVAEAETATGPFTRISERINPGSEWTEGPSVVKHGDQFIIYHDMYEAGKYGALSAPSMRGPWTDVSEEVHLPARARHGTVFHIPKEALAKLVRGLVKNSSGKWAANDGLMADLENKFLAS